MNSIAALPIESAATGGDRQDSVRLPKNDPGTDAGEGKGFDSFLTSPAQAPVIPDQVPADPQASPAKTPKTPPAIPRKVGGSKPGKANGIALTPALLSLLPPRLEKPVAGIPVENPDSPEPDVAPSDEPDTGEPELKSSPVFQGSGQTSPASLPETKISGQAPQNPMNAFPVQRPNTSPVIASLPKSGVPISTAPASGISVPSKEEVAGTNPAETPEASPTPSDFQPATPVFRNMVMMASGKPTAPPEQGSVDNGNKPVPPEAKVAEPEKQQVLNTVKYPDITMQVSDNKSIVNHTEADGTSPAMQHDVMPVVKNQPRTTLDTDAVSAPANPSATGSADSPEAVKPVAKSAGDFVRDAKSRADEPIARPLDAGSGAVQPQHEETASLPTVSSSSQAPAPYTSHDVTTVVKQMAESVERIRSDGQTSVDMQVKLRDGTELAMRLEWRDGHVEPIFKTDSGALRQAIEQNWTQFSSESTNRGLNVTTPVFAAPDARSAANDLNQQQQDRRQHPAEAWEHEAPGFFPRGGQASSSQTGNRPQVKRAASREATGLELYA